MVLNPVRFYSNYDKVTTDNAKIMHISVKCLSLELYCFQMVELLLTSRYMNKEQNLKLVSVIRPLRVENKNYYWFEH